MCGIVGYIGNKNAVPILMAGLKRLEYRGYDSAGIAVMQNNQVQVTKEAGKLAVLEAKLNKVSLSSTVGIGHTRWATHGEPNELNAHPHRDTNDNVFLVHNGIIENYMILKKKLQKDGIVFRSETDTEVLAHLVSKNFDGDLSEAVRKTMSQLEGTFGLAVIHR